MILGIDEVGRGPWAGPLVVGAVVLGGAQIDGLTDSKKLTKRRRNELDVRIREQASAWALGWVSAEEIDQIGLSAALKRATIDAVKQISAPYHEIIIDGTINFLADTAKGKYVTTMKKADLLIPSVSAAAIIAKVARDTFMEEQDAVYEGYKFASHVGYGTAAHRTAIEALGVTPLHRLSFAPLQKYRTTTQPREKIVDVRKVTSKQIGDDAESLVVSELEMRGHEIIARNWRTKYCEIDIISEHDDVVYFTEVKYRKTSDRGGGLVAITPAKVRQMTFAAELYAAHKKHDAQVQLAAASVSGAPARLDDWFPLS